MASTTTTVVSSSTTTAPSIPIPIPSTPSLTTTPGGALPRSLRKIRLPTPHHRASGTRLAASVSTPNLGALFASHAPAHAAPPPVPALPSLPQAHPQALPHPHPHPSLTRKASLATLTPSSLATIPDATESYALHELVDSTGILSNTGNTSNTTTTNTMPPLTPSGGRFAASMSSYAPPLPGPGDELAVGDTVDVPGGMTGVVRFVGAVNGRKGVFAGVELHPDYASRGKNNGDVDGISYFHTNIPDAGIFVPLNKAVRRDSTSSHPSPGGLRLASHNATNFTPPTPSLPKFSQSVSGGGPPRAPSPQSRRPPRTSLPRPDSPVRRLQMTTPAPSRPSLATPAAAAPTGRFGSPTPSKFSQSMRAPMTSGAGDPSKRGIGISGGMGGGGRKQSIGPRSASALGGASTYGGGGGDDSSSSTTTRPKTNGSGSGSFTSAASASTVSMGMGALGGPRVGARSPSRVGARSPSRAAGGGGGFHAKNGSQTTAAEEEIERLRMELEDRNRQLKDQANTLSDMESSLTELQTLIESSDLVNGGGGGDGGGGGGGGGGPDGDLGLDVKDMAQMRALLREKNEKIAMLTAEFDAHRADFRSTIDTLEMASTETERVYEKKIEDLMQDIQELENRLADVNVMANQLKQLEEFVQELEEGLEDARRGEAEARSEVEFLHGEVERTRTELRREREKAAAMMANGGGGVSGKAAATSSSATTASEATMKELEQKDDEIRGLKAIIHSLSQNGGVQPHAGGDTHHHADQKDSNGNGNPPHNGTHRRGESINERLARERLEREVAELRAVLDTKASREAEMERELEQLRAAPVQAPSINNANAAAHRSSALTLDSRSSLRDSRGTVVLAREFGDLASDPVAITTVPATNTAAAPLTTHHVRGPTLDTMPESDAYSSVTEASTLWCEICETNGHDILTCTNMFGPQQAAANGEVARTGGGGLLRTSVPGADAIAPLRPLKTATSMATLTTAAAAATPPVQEAPRARTPTASLVDVQILPNPMEGGPVAGKESGVVDADKWCALCERDGHDSVDCPFEDAF